MNVQEINAADKKVVDTTETSNFVAPRQYIEVPGRSGKDAPVDGLKQLAANVASLENLQSQMSFMMRELRSLNLKSR